MQDVSVLSKILPNAEVRVVPEKLFGHLDFLFHDEAKELVYHDILHVIDRYNNYGYIDNSTSTTKSTISSVPKDFNDKLNSVDYLDLTTFKNIYR